LKGDVDGDSNVNLADAIMALQALSGINPGQIQRGADVNRDDKIGMDEAIYVLQIVAGIRTGDYYEIGLFSGHFQNGYYAQLNVRDPDHKAISVTATGPGISGTADFLYYSSRESWWIETNPFLGSNAPTEPQIFSFTITDASGSYTFEKTLTGYVTQFAENLSPTGDAGGTITFAWTGIPGADGYSLELSDNQNNRIWNAYNLSSMTHSVVYGGPELETGHIYHYTVVSQIKTDGVSNHSYASASFTYTE